MGLLGWFRRSRNGTDDRLVAWRRTWSAAANDPSAAHLPALTAQLTAFNLPEEEVEIEREMLHALDELLRLRAAVSTVGLPIVETTHRVIGGDRCHFSAPVSLPDDDAQPSGRLLLTASRAVFVGAGRTMHVAWHAVGDVRLADRDLLLVRRDRQHLYRFRCNTYADAVCGSFLSGHLSATLRQGPPAAERS
jgi:hypothetical protein